ncbi:MAG TPA: L-2-hydroxyglutarate oxidase [Solirubrobacteraceae bacterium]|nr:L-2-hydroxyglutarate oxidase [Solirubrobacteraceae bacterium]
MAAAQPAPEDSADPPARCDLAVIGGGILGLAVARELARRFPHASLCVLERECALAAHQTGHSSGVIHAGIYYRPGSLKARLCASGARELYEYCAQHGIPHDRCGKVILAASRAELPRLDDLQRRAALNGVPGVRRIGPAELSELEPHATALEALHSPATGLVDFAAVARALAGDVRDAGARIVTGFEVTRVRAGARALQLSAAERSVEARHAVFCAGAWADRLAIAARASADPRIVPFRGAYLRVRPQRRSLVRSLIYPVPDPSLPFLGAHISRRIDGEVLIGPTALIVGARDAYALRTVRGADLLDTLAWPGTWRMLARWWRTGLTELHRSASVGALVRAAARYVPALRADDVERGPAGVRAQALARNGSLLDDFVFSHTERSVHVRNAPSPGASASLAIARHVADEAQQAFGLAR